MTKVAEHTNIQVSAKRASEAFPREIVVGRAHLELGDEVATAERGLKRFEATWAEGASYGTGAVEILSTSQSTTEISVVLERPKGFRGLIWMTRSLHRLAGLFAQAVRYDIETRSEEKADAFTVRRTSPELVRARTAAAVAM